MGQYYMAYVRNDEGERVFCPQNAIFMTRNNLGPNDKAKHIYDNTDPNCWGSCFSGLKLVEHSWIENDFVNGVLEAIWTARAESHGSVTMQMKSPTSTSTTPSRSMRQYGARTRSQSCRSTRFPPSTRRDISST